MNSLFPAAAQLIVLILVLVTAVVAGDFVQRFVEFDDNKLVIVRPKRADVAADASTVVEIKNTWTAFSCELDSPRAAADRSFFLANAKRRFHNSYPSEVRGSVNASGKVRCLER